MHYVLKLGTVALGVSLLFAVPTFADESENAPDEAQATVETQAPEEAQAAVESNGNDRICRRVRTTGTRLTQRICMSRDEWTNLREESQESLREARDDAGANTSTVGGDR